MMIRKIRQSPLTKFTAVFLSANFLFTTVPFSDAFALTGGPSQPEVQSFEPIGTSEMVDLFSGDFVYNIPLLDVGGYPVNLSYHSGVSMDQEATVVGLGWNINPGVINRGMRSLPDDFNGDKVSKELNLRDNQTWGINVGAEVELLSIKPIKGNFGLSFGLGAFYNSYKGIGFELGITPEISAGLKNRNKLTAGLGLSANSESGLGITPKVSFEKILGEADDAALDRKGSATIGLKANSRAGLIGMNISTSAQHGHIITQRNDAGDIIGEGFSATEGSNGGSSISFAGQSYVPNISMPTNNLNASLTVKLGGELFGVFPNGSVSGYYSTQYLAVKQRAVETPAYGYLHVQEGTNSEGRDDILLDFNRENDGTFTENTPALPLTNFTYDIYSVAGQGVGGTYRPFRGDIGMLYDRENHSTGVGANLPSYNFGTGNLTKIGLDASINATFIRSGRWVEDNNVAGDLAFRRKTTNDPLFEPVYFKQAGEKAAASNPGFINHLRGTDPVRIGLTDKPLHAEAERRLALWNNESGNGVTAIDNAKTARANRERRNQAITLLTASEAAVAGLETRIHSVGPFDAGTKTYTAAPPKNRTDFPGHHTSEITTLRPDGARYVYGIPAYNHTQHEVSFTVSHNKASDCSKGLVTYEADVDNSTSNTSGQDHFFSRTIMPPFAHSYLLTAVLSPDYADSDSKEGPTDGDFGSWTKFTWNRAVENYNWRVPYQENMANFNPGLKADNFDNKASYVFGTKDIWYLNTIETKTHVAEFIYTDRLDGFGVNGHNGGGETAKQPKKLKRIDLYAKEDRLANGDKAVVIKSVHFEYDYSLCPELPNNCSGISNCSVTDPDLSGPNGGGKLTLKRLFFTYGNSQKGRLNSYKFHYADPDHDGIINSGYNPSYNLKGYDRWGNFKPNPDGADCTGPATALANPDFPFTGQEVIPQGDPLFNAAEPGKTFADVYAQAWTLSTIELPSGGVIRVDYEADRYGYVQDKRAMQMFFVTGAGDSPSSPVNGNELFKNKTQNQNYLFFKLQKPLSLSVIGGLANATDFIRREYLPETGNLFFRFLMNVDGKGKYEWVPGYTSLDAGDPAGAVAPDPQSPDLVTHGYIQLTNDEPIGDKDNADKVNPVSKAAWNFAKLYMPRDAYNSPQINENGKTNVFDALGSAFEQLAELFKGTNRSLRRREFGRFFVTDRSFVRLNNPDKSKLGGGVRVRQVSISDNWGKMLTAPDPNRSFDYGQLYTYETTEEGRTISSGVAAYEPEMGGEENPLRQPVFFDEEKKLAPDDEFYQEKPYGESFFPGAGVGYSKVTVTNLPRAGVKRNATGKVVHQFYTAKDFPVIARPTSVKVVRHKPNVIAQFLKFDARDFFTASQGFVVELNDMHGKQKAQYVFAEDKADPISGVEFRYKQAKRTYTMPIPASAPETIQVNALDNVVNVVEREPAPPTARVHKAEVGVDYDFVTDLREHSSQTIGASLQGNLDAFLLFVFPGVIPILIPGFSAEKVRFRSAVTTKVINRYGILEETIATDLGSRVSTKNLAWDAETGEVLLTETVNEFDDDVFSFTYPSHWPYDGMGPAFKNIEAAAVLPVAEGIIPATFVPSWLLGGDEVLVRRVSPPGPISKAWVLRNEATGDAGLIARDGTLLTGLDDDHIVKVIRSGRRNVQSAPVGMVTSLVNPLTDTDADNIADDLVFDDTKRILNAGAVEFAEEWQTPCCAGAGDEPVCNISPSGIEEMLDFLNSPPNAGFGDGNSVGDGTASNHFNINTGCQLSSGNATASVDCGNAQTLVVVTLSQGTSDPGCTFPDDPQQNTGQWSEWAKLLDADTCDLAGATSDIVGVGSATSECEECSVPNGTTECLSGWQNSLLFTFSFSIKPGNCDTLSCHLTLIYDGSDPFSFDDILFYHSLQPSPTPGQEGDVTVFTVVARLSDGRDVVLLGSSCVPVGFCETPDTEGPVSFEGGVVNPYVAGIRGNWRAKRSFLYLTDREQAAQNPRPDIRDDGPFTAFAPFWGVNTGNNWVAINDATHPDHDLAFPFDRWQFTSEVTRFSPFGFEVENRDALDRSSAAIYGYRNTLPVGVASNSRYREIGFDGFEDYVFNDPEDCRPTHFGFFGTGAVTDNTEAHTGFHSVKVSPLFSYVMLRSYGSPDDETTLNEFPQDTLNAGDCLGLFDPLDGKRYVLTYWVKEATAQQQFDYSGPFAVVYLDNQAVMPVSTTKNDVIDGWQRVEMVFDIPPGSSGFFQLALSNAGQNEAFFDDIRIQPFDASMKAFVYDPVSLRLAAELDERNFATFYEYDEEGALVRVKKETERGIMTIQESRNSARKAF